MNKSSIDYSIKLILVVLLSTIISMIMRKLGIEKDSIMMVFLVGVLLVTVITKGYFYGAVASILSVLIFNYIFTVPVHTFEIYSTSDITLLLFFFISSIISSSLTSRIQKQAEIAEKNECTARLLCEITDNFSNITGKKNIVIQGISYIYNHTGCKSKVTLSDTNETFYKDESINESKCDMNKLNLDIHGINKKLGEIEIFFSEDNLSLENELLIKMVATQIGISLDRELIYYERENIRIEMERERLRSNLIRGISHDLRTPLTAIVGASGVVIDNINKLPQETIKDLVKDINEEALWLNNLVENILNMTRIGEGKLVIKKQDEVVDDIVDESLRHISGLLSNRDVQVSLPREVISIPVDGKLIVQVLINLLDNAVKYTDEKCTIYLRVFQKDDFVVFEIADNGEGINESIIDKIFDSFVSYSGKIVDGKRGMGLGLAICKAIINAHGGEITAGKSPEGGALFSFTLPL
ncbi:MAG: two-component system, OmpR family, sensor histidine kinase KdpD [Clostridium butyricum]|uniref:histidine kinase n=1 Tax=Clostridium butyricum TaxID=1492 RepID=A0A6L9EQK6_CLOBU|nr:MAG: Sensor protein KdpD [Clostridium butyricum DORA_1]MDK2827491.1 two-component system, OmpR family, sensor histidine kinase KdpD [Clostridium butyricum]MDU1509248.1 DUF4118 domain-containing protein [Clostridium butyricum]MDU4802864.1 DUF4118 domain-containing protein [Clostridium butyricum]MDU6040433.1 DUF4118 domain-containing protein [Clostridium butyricum]